MGNRLSPAQREFYIQIKSHLVLGNISFNKRDLKPFVKFIFEHFPATTREDVLMPDFWGRVGRKIYDLQVQGRISVGRFFPLFHSILNLLKKKGESWVPSSPTSCSSPRNPIPSSPKGGSGDRSCHTSAQSCCRLSAASRSSLSHSCVGTGHPNTCHSCSLHTRDPNPSLKPCCSLEDLTEQIGQNGACLMAKKDQPQDGAPPSPSLQKIPAVSPPPPPPTPSSAAPASGPVPSFPLTTPLGGPPVAGTSPQVGPVPVGGNPPPESHAPVGGSGHASSSPATDSSHATGTRKKPGWKQAILACQTHCLWDPPARERHRALTQPASSSEEDEESGSPRHSNKSAGGVGQRSERRQLRMGIWNWHGTWAALRHRSSSGGGGSQSGSKFHTLR
ncbi:uncharacterized protein LOC128783143 [Vidua chalybeata]|uniref:uncharacterized protein LOC128783143 n=1 Tax=Vidua chalybeata TaxID=81927 RepID=UPI0023A813D2|nr:uncharacterized protein LOC128783143 [Vidua chalybeata]